MPEWRNDFVKFDPTKPKTPTGRQLRHIVRDWERAGEQPPMIGDIPISRELLEQLAREREARD
jgi:hypothetical protein